jgi:stage II sporulation protein D
LPYLRSVPSPWDKNSPRFTETTTYSLDEVEKRLGVKVTDKISVQRTSSNRVSSISINGKKMTGIDVRDALGLRSTDFSFIVKGDHVLITTKGYGHGVGMSQYGANEMAKQGKKHKEILEYYYKGIAIEDVKSNKEYNKLLVNEENK